MAFFLKLASWTGEMQKAGVDSLFSDDAEEDEDEDEDEDGGDEKETV